MPLRCSGPAAPPAVRPGMTPSSRESAPAALSARRAWLRRAGGGGRPGGAGGGLPGVGGVLALAGLVATIVDQWRPFKGEFPRLSIASLVVAGVGALVSV